MTHFAGLKDKNLKPENIKKGVKIFKVTGTFEGGGGGDWLVDALVGNITDLSGYELPAPRLEYQYYCLFNFKGITKSPRITGAIPVTAKFSCYNMFSTSKITHLYCGGLTEVNAQSAFGYFCRSCVDLEFIDF